MSDLSSTVVPIEAATGRDATEAADVLSRALRGRCVPPRTAVATGANASPDEGLALVGSLLAIGDAALRQALLDAAAALAT